MTDQQPNPENNKYLKQQLDPNGIVTDRLIVETKDHCPAIFSYTLGYREGRPSGFLVAVEFLDDKERREGHFMYKDLSIVPTEVHLYWCLPSDEFVQKSQRVAEDIMFRFVGELSERIVSDIVPVIKSQLLPQEQESD